MIFYNCMVKSQLSLRDTDILTRYIFPVTNQISGACLTIISILFQTCICPFNRNKELPEKTMLAYLDLAFMLCSKFCHKYIYNNRCSSKINFSRYC